MEKPAIPLAERMRPQHIDDIIGQSHLLGTDGPIRRMVMTNSLPSIILWGPPGTGKTTLAYVISKHLQAHFFTLSAISSGVKDVRDVIEKAKSNSKTILFIDEIHRFTTSQQDALLGAVEKGMITLIGATTENPSFEVNKALLSRCQVYVMNSLSEDELLVITKHAIEKDTYLKTEPIELNETDALLRLSGGDARKLLNLLEVAITLSTGTPIQITNRLVTEAAQQRTIAYDKSGEMHYDIISAFIKSICGSDPNAATYWLARMIEGGEDVRFIARRLVILASEDIGNANPTALVLATSCFQAVDMIGHPEARIILSQCTIYLACSPKSNASYMAIEEALALVREKGDLPVPLHLRNAPTKLMKQLGYGKEYHYPHNYENNFNTQDYLPEELKNSTLYNPGNNVRENELRDFLKKRWKEKYTY